MPSWVRHGQAATCRVAYRSEMRVSKHLWLTALAILAAGLLAEPIAYPIIVNSTSAYREPVESVAFTPSRTFPGAQVYFTHQRIMHVDEAARITLSLLPPGTVGNPNALKCELVAPVFKQVKTNTPLRAECDWIVVPEKAGEQIVEIDAHVFRGKKEVGSISKFETLSVWKSWTSPENLTTVLGLLTGVFVLIQTARKTGKTGEITPEKPAEKKADDSDAEAESADKAEGDNAE